MPRRTALLIRCSGYEAVQIRERAASERRTVSGYLLNILMRRIRVDETLTAALMSGLSLAQSKPETSSRGVETRTAVLLRCSAEEASRIRAAAKRRGATISGFVLVALRLTWKLAGPIV